MTHTVVITSHSRPAHLEAALISCVRAGIEHIIITATGVTAAMRLVFLKIQSQHPKVEIVINPEFFTNNDSWLAGVDAVKTKWVTLLHDDDLLLPGFDFHAHKIMESGQGFGMVSANSHGCPNYVDRVIDASGPQSSSAILSQIIKPKSLSISPIRGVFKTQDLMSWLQTSKGLPQHCFYRPGFVVGNDLLIWVQACEQYQSFFNVAEPAVSYGHWEGSTTVKDLSGPGRLVGMYEAARRWYRARGNGVAKISTKPWFLQKIEEYKLTV